MINHIFLYLKQGYMVVGGLHNEQTSLEYFRFAYYWVQTYKWVFFPMRFKNSLN